MAKKKVQILGLLHESATLGILFSHSLVVR